MAGAPSEGAPPVTLALTASGIRPLAPLLAALETVRAGEAAFGVADGLVVGDDPAGGWLPAAELLTGPALADLLAGPTRLWGAKPHAAAALAYKQYTYWLAMPAVLGWAVARRVPLLSADNVAVRLDPPGHPLAGGVGPPAGGGAPGGPAARPPGGVGAGAEGGGVPGARRTPRGP